MCGTCGCGVDEQGIRISDPKSNGNHHHDHIHHGHNHHHHHDHTHNGDRRTVLEVQQDILSQNDLMAARNRGYFDARKIFALNLVSSPGSGKTSFLERTLTDLKGKYPFYVIEGDQQTLNDANRIAAMEVPVRQINTGQGCHLESETVYQAVKQLNMDNESVLMIENVGNLVCPSMFDLGENKRVVIVSTTEGVDKPLKYPDMFHSSDICVINKVDLVPYLDIDLSDLRNNALKVNPDLKFFEVSATHGTGMTQWYEWLEQECKKLS